MCHRNDPRNCKLTTCVRNEHLSVFRGAARKGATERFADCYLHASLGCTHIDHSLQAGTQPSGATKQARVFEIRLSPWFFTYSGDVSASSHSSFDHWEYSAFVCLPASHSLRLSGVLTFSRSSHSSGLLNQRHQRFAVLSAIFNRWLRKVLKSEFAA